MGKHTHTYTGSMGHVTAVALFDTQAHPHPYCSGPQTTNPPDWRRAKQQSATR